MPSHKEFYDALNNISVNADTLNLNTDQVETKLDTTTGILTTISADTAIIKADMADGVSVNVNGTVPVSGTITANAGTGTYTTSDRGATGEATVTSFTSTSSAILKASNSSRKLLTIFNEGAGNLHVLYGNGTASTTNYSVRIASGDYLEVDKYTGQLTAIFASAGTARVTEIT